MQGNRQLKTPKQVKLTKAVEIMLKEAHIKYMMANKQTISFCLFVNGLLMEAAMRKNFRKKEAKFTPERG